MIQYHKCGKAGHYGRDCRTSRHANRFALPKANKHTEMNMMEKYCTHCKKAGHGRKKCWTLHGRPKKMQERQQRPNNKKPQHTTTLIKRKEKRNDDSDSSPSFSSSSEEEEVPRTKTLRPARKYKVTQIHGNSHFSRQIRFRLNDFTHTESQTGKKPAFCWTQERL